MNTNYMPEIGWGTNIKESNELICQPYHNEVKKWSFLSGILCGEIAIVEDSHFVPEWREDAPHLNIRVKCKQSIYGRIPKQEFPLPSVLTKKHYRLYELEQIIAELFGFKKN